MATRKEFTLSVIGKDLKCFLNERKEVVITINDDTGNFISINIDSEDELEELLDELDGLMGKMKSL